MEPPEPHDYFSAVPAPHPSFMFKHEVYHDIDEWAHAVLSRLPVREHANAVKRYRTHANYARESANRWAKEDPKYEDYARSKERTAVSMKRQADALADAARKQHAARKQRELLLMVQGPSSGVPSGLYGGSRRRNKKSKNSKKRSNKSRKNHRRK